MKDRLTLEKRFQQALSHCILLNVLEKKTYLAQLPGLTDALLEQAITVLEEKNGITDKYINAALLEDKDQKYLEALKKITTEDQKTAKKMFEDQTKLKAGQILEKEIQNL